MEALSTYQRFNAAIEAGDFETVEKLTHDDYAMTGAFPKPAGKAEMLRFLKAAKEGIPDLAFNFTGLREDGDEVSGLMHIRGTHTERLDLSFMDIPPQEPTRNRVAMPEEPVKATIKDGKVLREHVEPVPGGGLEGFLQQLGIAVQA
jgi:hypothetical protein